MILGAAIALTLLVGLWLARPLLAAAPGRGLWLGIVALFLAGGIGAYALAGRPDLPDQPAPPRPQPAEASREMAAAYEALRADPANVAGWINLSLALGQMGQTAKAAEGLRVALGAMPGQPDLWVAYGETLVAHAEGQVTPAARLAFDKASQLAPNHPGPKFYLALAWMQAGRPKEALAALEDLKRASPADAPWLPRVERMMRGAQAMMDAGLGDGMGAGTGGAITPPAR